MASAYCFVTAARGSMGVESKISWPVIVPPAIGNAPRFVSAWGAVLALVPPYSISIGVDSHFPKIEY